MLGLPPLAGFSVVRLAAHDDPPRPVSPFLHRRSPADSGCLAAVCAAGTAALVLAALAMGTIAIYPQKLALFGPNDGTCPTCSSQPVVIPPGLRHEYQVGFSIADDASAERLGVLLFWVPILALFAGGLGAGLGQVSLRIGDRRDSAGPPAPPAPSQTRVRPLRRTRNVSLVREAIVAVLTIAAQKLRPLIARRRPVR